VKVLAKGNREDAVINQSWSAAWTGLLCTERTTKTAFLTDILRRLAVQVPTVVATRKALDSIHLIS